jgi:hypothetical protein
MGGWPGKKPMGAQGVRHRFGARDRPKWLDNITTPSHKGYSTV